MGTYRRRLMRPSPRLLRLESRAAPSASNVLVSRADPSMLADTGGGYVEAISADGRYVAFVSAAGNIVPGQVDVNGGGRIESVDGFQGAGSYGSDVFVFDRATNNTELISHAAGFPARTGNGSSFDPVMSADGRYVAFISEATDIVPGMVNPPPQENDGPYNVFIADRLQGHTTLVTRRHDSAIVAVPSWVTHLLLSDNGQRVVFSSRSGDFVAGFPNLSYGVDHVYAYSTVSGQVSLVDHIPGDKSYPGYGFAHGHGLSADGRYVTIFPSRAI